MNSTFHNVRIPASSTLKRYGLSLSEWKIMLELQDYVCFICLKIPDSGRLHIDHSHHIPKGKWKKLNPEQRKETTRGLLCMSCNYRLVNKLMTLPKARRIVLYLEKYEERIQL